MSPPLPPPYTSLQSRLASFSPSSTAAAKYFASTASLEPQKTVTEVIMEGKPHQGRGARSRGAARRPGDMSSRDRGIAPEPRGLRPQDGTAAEARTQLLVAHLDDPRGFRI